LVRTRYDDGGFSGGNLERPALQHLLADSRAGRIDIGVVYKVDRLTRSLADFARLVELFDAEAVSFVSVMMSECRGLHEAGSGNRRQRRYIDALPVSLQSEAYSASPFVKQGPAGRWRRKSRPK
jgi:hypothetical protein